MPHDDEVRVPTLQIPYLTYDHTERHGFVHFTGIVRPVQVIVRGCDGSFLVYIDAIQAHLLRSSLSGHVWLKRSNPGDHPSSEGWPG